MLAEILIAVGITTSGAAIRNYIEGNRMQKEASELQEQIIEVKSEIENIDSTIEKKLNCRKGYRAEIMDYSAVCILNKDLSSSSNGSASNFNSSFTNQPGPDIPDIPDILYSLYFLLEFCRANPKECAQMLNILKQGAIQLKAAATLCFTNPYCWGAGAVLITTLAAIHELIYMLEQESNLENNKATLKKMQSKSKLKNRLLGNVEGFSCDNLKDTYMFVNVPMDKNDSITKLCIPYDQTKKEDEKIRIKIDHIIEEMSEKLVDIIINSVEANKNTTVVVRLPSGDEKILNLHRLMEGTL